MMAYRPDEDVSSRMKRYYQSSTRYRDDLITHGKPFLDPFIQLVERHVQRPARILDLGCGTGLSTNLLNEAGYETCGVDISPLFLSVEKQNTPEIDLLASDALRLPFADDTFDTVAAFEFVEHVHDIPALLDEILRVVKTRGFIVIHSPNLFSPYLPAFDLIRMLAGGEGRPVFAETVPQAFRWFRHNLFASILKKLYPRPCFVYREPDLSEQEIGGDSDSVYLANQIDLCRYLKSKGCAIDKRAHAMSLKNKFLVALTPNFAPYIGVVAHKLSTAKPD